MRHVFRFLGRPVSQDEWVLEDEESHHLNKVLRLKEGDLVEATDGLGLWAQSLIETIGKNTTTLRVSRSQDGTCAVYRDPTPAPRINLAIGALRPGAIDEILPSLVELGMDALHLFHQPGSAKTRLADKAFQRWERLMIQAVKQCKRSWLPQISTHDDLASFLGKQGINPDCLGFYLSPDGSFTLIEALLAPRPAKEHTITLVIGGELGLSRSEESQLEAQGFQGVRLGQHILRAVTAAVGAGAVTSCYRDRGRP